METREQWLEKAVEALRTFFTDTVKPAENIKVSCGFPSTKALSDNPRVGECWQPASSEDKKTTQIFISPRLHNDARVLDVLLHELIHACGIQGHRANFKAMAESLGLEGPSSATTAGDALRIKLNEVADTLGPYPSTALLPARKKKKESTRLLKLICPKCGYIVRTTKKWTEVGLPTCIDGTAFKLDDGSVVVEAQDEPEEGE